MAERWLILAGFAFLIAGDGLFAYGLGASAREAAILTGLQALAVGLVLILVPGTRR